MKRTSILLPKTLSDAIAALAQSENTTQTNLIVMFLNQGIKHYPSNNSELPALYLPTSPKSGGTINNIDIADRRSLFSVMEEKI